MVVERRHPHFTINLDNGEVRQHSPMNRAARALRNASGGVQTNRDGVIQIEIIGTCDKSFARKHGYPYLPDMTDEMAGRLKWLLQKICAAIPAIPLTTSVAWKSYPSSYGNSSVRMSNSQWTRYKGILGHQHAPENTHGDPGDLPMKRILGADAVKGGSSSGGGSDYTVRRSRMPRSACTTKTVTAALASKTGRRMPSATTRRRDSYFGPDTEDGYQGSAEADRREGRRTRRRRHGRPHGVRPGGRGSIRPRSRKPAKPSGQRARPRLRLPLAEGLITSALRMALTARIPASTRTKNRSGKYDEEWLKALPEQLIRRGWSIGKCKTSSVEVR